MVLIGCQEVKLFKNVVLLIIKPTIVDTLLHSNVILSRKVKDTININYLYHWVSLTHKFERIPLEWGIKTTSQDYKLYCLNIFSQILFLVKRFCSSSLYFLFKKTIKLKSFQFFLFNGSVYQFVIRISFCCHKHYFLHSTMYVLYFNLQVTR